jgi:hypothetical protein
MTSPSAFDPVAAARALAAEGVAYVVIGGFAGRLWGSPTVTNDVDICYARDRENLRRLASVLAKLEARLRGAPADLPFVMDARTLENGDHFTLETCAGNLDLFAYPAGSGGFEKLSENAAEMEIADGLVVRVASISDLIRMKKAAGRPKDAIEVEVLSALKDEIDGR